MSILNTQFTPFRHDDGFGALNGYLDVLAKLSEEEKAYIRHETVECLKTCEALDMRKCLKMDVARRFYEHFPRSMEICRFYACWLFTQGT